MVRVLLAISILQIAAILLLYGKLSDIQHSLDRPAVAPITDNRSSPFRQQPMQTGGGIDEDRLRAIIREELSAELGQLSRGESTVTTSPAPVARDAEEAKRQRAQVFDQIDYFSSVGRISDVEMQKLQMDIARLDPAARTEALRELTRAINSGRLEGRL